jgi:AAA+ ATPase superfamily predicted ATPase
MTKDQLVRLICEGENSRTEFKRDDLLPEQLAREIVALLNTGGGCILIGVEDDGSVSGVVRGKIREWIVNICRDNVQPAILPKIEIIPFDSTKKVVVIDVPSERTEKCYRARLSGHWITFVRADCTCRQATQGEEERLYQGAPLTIIEEEQVNHSEEEIENPYNFAKPATKYFRGREEEIRKLARVLRERKSAVIFGLQRIGKTSLVERVLSDISTGPPNQQTICLRINMFDAWQSFNTDLSFLFTVLDQLAEHQRTDAKKAKAAIRDVFYESSTDIERFNKFRHALKEGARRTNSSLLLFIDEFHDIEKVFRRAREKKTSNPVDAGLFRQIGSLVKEGTLQLLICCRYKAVPMEREQQLEIFKLMDEINLGVLDEASARSLIRDPVDRAIKYDEQALRKILQYTGGHPYLIQFLCSELVGRPRVRRSRVVRMKEVEDCVEEITCDPMKESKFNVLYEDFQEIQDRRPWRALLAMAEVAEVGGRLIGRSEIITKCGECFRIGYEERNIKSVIDPLLLSQVVAEEKRGIAPSYWIRSDMLRLWLRNQRFLDGER